MDQIYAMATWGKDHWSLLAYVECCCVDGRSGVGTLDKRRLRTNEHRHPLHAVNSPATRWKPNYGTRLKGFFEACDPALQIPMHDDWDCLNDLEAAGLIEVFSEANALVELTAHGISVSGQLRAHKAIGGVFATFAKAAA
jgi:hypothetical protein